MTDIKERLRKYVRDRGGTRIENGAWQMMLEAADEIERLRSLVYAPDGREIYRVLREEAEWRAQLQQTLSNALLQLDYLDPKLTAIAARRALTGLDSNPT